MKLNEPEMSQWKLEKRDSCIEVDSLFTSCVIRSHVTLRCWKRTGVGMKLNEPEMSQ